MSKEKEKYAEIIKQFIPVNELSSQMQIEAIQKSEIINLRKGKFLFKQGDRDEFSFYLIDGELELLANDQRENIITSGTDRARYAMAQLQPRQFSARAKTPVVAMKIERSALDKLMVMSEGKQETGEDDLGSGFGELEVSDIDTEDDIDWMTKMLQSELFSRIPTANIHQLFALLEPLEFEKDQVVIKQGDPGEHYYIIQEGRCIVTRKPSSGNKEVKLAELRAGDSFGEEALIMEATRNATVTMTQPGILMQLSKDDFIHLIKEPTLQAVSYAQAQDLIHKGGCWLDVRFPNEHEESHIKGSINIPLNMLRMQMEKLDKDKTYVVYCDTGGRSSAAAFLLAEKGIIASYLTGGLISNPKVASEHGASADKKVEETEQTEPASTKEEEVQAVVEQDIKEVNEELDPDVRASIIETELERNNIRLQDMDKLRQEVTEKEKKAQEEIRKKLEEEREKLEEQKKIAQQEAEKLKKMEQEKIEQMKKEAEKKLQQEKKKLEQIYSKNTKEMEKIQRMKEEAEEKARVLQEKLDAEALEARKSKEQAEEQAKMKMEELEKESKEIERMREEAKRMKAELEASRLAMEKKAQEKIQKQQDREKELEKKVKEKLEQGRRKLAEQLAKNNQELELAQKEKAAAEAARKAAQEEAEKIIAEFKQEYEQARLKEEDKLRAEREKLEKESEKIKQSLNEIQREKEKAEQEKLEAQKQIAMLKIKKVQKSSDKEASKTLSEEIKAAEAKIDKATEQIKHVEGAEKEAEAAAKLNEKDLKKQNEVEEKLKKQLEDDLADFIKEQEQQAKTMSDKVSSSEFMERIKERAAEAKKQAEQATDNLFADIASQLGQE